LKAGFVSILLLLFFTFGFAQERMEIKSVRFKGNKALRKSQLKDQISLKSTSFLNRKIFKKEPSVYSTELYQDDVERLRDFYQKEGYLSVSFETPLTIITKRNRLILTYRINEGAPVKISEISFAVDSVYSLEETLPPRSQRIIKYQKLLKPKKIFRDEWLYKDQELITEQFNNEGYAYAEAKYKIDVDTAANIAAVDWMIHRDHLTWFGTVKVEGNVRVPDKSVLKQLTFKYGDKWSREEIDDTQKQIFNLGMFRVASVKTEMSEEKEDTLPIKIVIKEAPIWTIRFGAGVGREEKIRVFTDIQYLGFITNTGRINLFARHSALEPYNLSPRFTQPAFILPFNTLIINPFIRKENEPGYKSAKKGGDLSFLQVFSERFNTNVGYFYEDVQLDTINTAELEENLKNETFYSKSGITLGGMYNNSEPRLDPAQGVSLAMNLKWNGVFPSKEFPFYKIIGEFKTYQALREEWIIAFKIKWGGVKPTNESIVPIDERFFAGGSRSVRGWSRSNLGPKDEDGRPVGGNSLLESSLESRYTIGKITTLILFLDAGNVWKDSFSYNLKELRYAGGFGVRFKTPIGPAGIDLARPIFDRETTWQIHFNIGHPF